MQIKVQRRSAVTCKSRFVCVSSEVCSGPAVETSTHHPPADTPVEDLNWTESNIKLQGVSSQQLHNDPEDACGCCCSFMEKEGQREAPKRVLNSNKGKQMRPCWTETCWLPEPELVPERLGDDPLQREQRVHQLGEEEDGLRHDGLSKRDLVPRRREYDHTSIENKAYRLQTLQRTNIYSQINIPSFKQCSNLSNLHKIAVCWI